MAQIQSIQQFPCLRNLSDFVTDCNSADTIEKVCRATIGFFLAIPAMITDLLLYLPLEAYNGRFNQRTFSDLDIYQYALNNPKFEDGETTTRSNNCCTPSAPPYPVEMPVSEEIRLAQDIAFLRSALKDPCRKDLMKILKETSPNHPTIFPFTIASLALFHFLDQAYRPQSSLNSWPDFISLNTTFEGLPSLREIGVDFFLMSQTEKDRIEKELQSPNAITMLLLNDDPRTIENPVAFQIKRHAFQLCDDPRFLAACQALNIDLLAD